MTERLNWTEGTWNTERQRFMANLYLTGTVVFCHKWFQSICITALWGTFSVQFSPVTQSCLTLCDPMDCSTPGFPVFHQLLEPAQTHVHRRCHATISSSHVPFCLQSFLASGSFPMSQLFASGGQSIRDSALASVLPVIIQDWFPLGLSGWISLQSKGLSRVFSNTTVQKHQFFGAQLSLEFNSHTHTWLLEKP